MTEAINRSNRRGLNDIEKPKQGEANSGTPPIATNPAGSVALGSTHSTNQNAMISSQTIADESGSPMARPVIEQAQTPMNRPAHSSTAQDKSDNRGSIMMKTTQAQSVAIVPGATGNRPLPKPSAIRCAGCCIQISDAGVFIEVGAVKLEMSKPRLLTSCLSCTINGDAIGGLPDDPLRIRSLDGSDAGELETGELD
jgi:hypothetical protein